MEKVKISAGKLRGLQRLADEEGRFRMMAIDQRGSLKRMIRKATGKEPEYDDLAQVKKLIVKVLSPYSSATLIDPVYGFPIAAKYIPPDVGLLLALEETGYLPAGAGEKERKSRLIEGWSVAKIKRVGADGVKLLLYYRDDASPDVVEHQRGIARRVGEECLRYDIPFVLELVSYPFKGDEAKDHAEDPVKARNFAERKPQLVLDYVREFAKPEYHVDILKVEFPADLKYCAEYADGAFDGIEREPVYDLSEVEEFCREVTRAAKVPWVILSAGVGIEEFLEEVEIASRNGASGFLCGRALWKYCVDYYPDLDAVEEWLSTSGVENFRRLYAASQEARPFFETEAFRGFPSLELEGSGPEWYRSYPGF